MSKKQPKPTTNICGEKSTGTHTGSGHVGPNFSRDPRTGILVHDNRKSRNLPGGRVKDEK